MIDQSSILRPLPHAEGSEKFVLSSFFKDPDLVADFPLDPEIFYLPAHRTIYRQMLESKPLEIGLFAQALFDSGKIEDIGGPVILSDLLTYAVGPHFHSHLARIRNRHARRMAISAASSAAEAAFDCSDGDDGENYLEALAGPFSAIFDYAAGNAVEQDTKALAREFLDKFERRLAGELTPMGIPFGIGEIDGILPGLHSGHMGIISGPPGGGKSTLATQIAGNLADEGIPTLYLPYERGALSVYSRTVIQRAGVEHRKVSDPLSNTPNTYDLRRIRDAVKSSVGSLYFPAPKTRKAVGCYAMIRRYHRMHGIKVAIVDQIGLLRGERRQGGNAEEELRLISNGFQELAHELGITIIVLCQVTAEGETKSARAIEEDADWWLSIILERDKKKSNFGEHQHILVAKDSHNGKGGERIPLILDRDTLRFTYGLPAKPQIERKTRFQP
jgi:replicative DNA helicase